MATLTNKKGGKIEEQRICKFPWSIPLERIKAQKYEKFKREKWAKDTVVEAAGEKECALIKSKEKVRFFQRELLQLKKKKIV